MKHKQNYVLLSLPKHNVNLLINYFFISQLNALNCLLLLSSKQQFYYIQFMCVISSM
jgi:hypothetical protein